MLAGQSTGARPGWLGRFLRLTCAALAALVVAPAARSQVQPETPAQSSQSTPAKTVPEEYRFAAGLYRQQRWDLAGEAFRKFIKNHPDHERVPYARLYLGLTLVNADKYADARDVLRAYVRDYPQSRSLPDALYRAGECSYLLDDLKSAERELGRFVKEYPRHELVEWALPYLGDSELRLKDPAAARESFKTALERFPKSRLADDSKFGLARAYEDLHQDRAAGETYAELAADKNSPRAPQALLNLATLRFRLGQFEEASQTFLRLTEEFPKSPLIGAAHLNAGFAFYQLARYPRAMEEFDRAARESKKALADLQQSPKPALPDVDRIKKDSDLKRQAATAGYWNGLSEKALGDYEHAGEHLKATYESDRQGPLAEGAHYYWAECELRTGHFDAAKNLFLEGVEKWPKGDLADDGLHFAGEAALQGGSIDEAKRLVERFEKTNPNSPLKLHEQILKARVLNADAAALLKEANRPDRPLNGAKAEQERREAIAVLENVISQSHRPDTIALARFCLGRTLEDTGDFAKAVDVLAPLVTQADQPKASSEAVDALALSGHALVAIGKFAKALPPLTKYLSLRPKSSQAERALADRAVAHARLNRPDESAADVAQLIGNFPHSSTAAETVRRLAEFSYDAQDFKTARDRFAKLAELGEPKSDVRRMGLSGVGWSQFELKAFDKSTEAFAEVFEKFPTDILQVAEAGYMRARALQQAGKLADAAQAYSQAFEKLAPAGAASPGEELHGPTQYGFLSGMQSANLLAQLKRYDDADAAYRRLAERYPKAGKLSDVLFDWANLLYVAKKDAPQKQRIRDVLTRIERDFPASAVEPKARLFLAELDAQEGQANPAEKTLRGLIADVGADAKTREDALARLVTLSADKQEWKNVRELSQKYLAAFPKGVDARVVRLQSASAELHLNDAASAEKTLAELLRELKGDTGQPAAWWPNVWILLAESQYQQKKYDELDATVQDLRGRMPDSPLLPQADEVLGRSFKNRTQWDKALAAFQRAIEGSHGEQSDTAAKSQLMIAEIRFLQKDFRQAKEEYLKVSTLYDRLPDWAAPALFQVGQCEEELQQTRDAEKTYTQLIASFPRSDFAKDAKKRLDELRKRPAG
ncbi:MAG TPA: tetratricopeptide repeat protein [Planctomycetaceae bacterium]|jgi:TolA-binding protein|nr:tetratricopeptide repeat protein [Planctomycetaceae bacterium]